jgi:hypothetical protein
MTNTSRWAKEAARRVDGKVVRTEWDGMPPIDGRHGFYATIEANGVMRVFALAMPGVPCVKGNIWDRPRLYVDGNSWAWEYSFPDHEYFSKEGT